MSEHIALTDYLFEVAPIAAELAEHEHLWNEYRGRLDFTRSPHRETDDIWLRFSRSNLGRVGYLHQEPDELVWYPAADELPATKALAEEMFALTGAHDLGGIILIRIPPGKRIYSHRDLGWHAAWHKKIAVQIVGNPKQRFCFEDGSIGAEAGDSYVLDNSFAHWVTNDTDEPWINMTVCYRN